MSSESSDGETEQVENSNIEIVQGGSVNEGIQEELEVVLQRAVALSKNQKQMIISLQRDLEEKNAEVFLLQRKLQETRGNIPSGTAEIQMLKKENKQLEVQLKITERERDTALMAVEDWMLHSFSKYTCCNRQTRTKI